MPYILVRGNLDPRDITFPWKVLVSGLKASDIEQLRRFTTGGNPDDMTIPFLHHPCVILTALEVLGYKVVACSNNGIKNYNEYMWTMKKEFAEPEPEPEPIIKRMVQPPTFSTPITKKQRGRPSHNECPIRLQAKHWAHFPEDIPSTTKKKSPTKRCHVCVKHNIRSETT